MNNPAEFPPPQRIWVVVKPTGQVLWDLTSQVSAKDAIEKFKRQHGQARPSDHSVACFNLAPVTSDGHLYNQKENEGVKE